MARRNFPRDPHWITLRHDGACTGCAKPVKRSSRAFYYPNGKSLFGQDCGCGEQKQNEFDAALADETFYNTGY